MSSGSPSHTVHEVGGPLPRKPEQSMSGDPEQLPLQIVQRSVDCRLRRLLSRNRRQPRADLLQRKRVVSDELGVLLDEAGRRRRPTRRSGRRGRLSVSGDARVSNRDVDDVCMVGRFSGDDERLRQLQADAPGLDLHARSLRLAYRHDVRDGVGLFLRRRPAQEASPRDPARSSLPPRRHPVRCPRAAGRRFLPRLRRHDSSRTRARRRFCPR